jgi:hypothetical protein
MWDTSPIPADSDQRTATGMLGPDCQPCFKPPKPKLQNYCITNSSRAHAVTDDTRNGRKRAQVGFGSFAFKDNADLSPFAC